MVHYLHSESQPSCSAIFTNATFLLTIGLIGSFLLTAEFFAYNGFWELVCLQLECFYLQFELFAFSGAFSLTVGKCI